MSKPTNKTQAAPAPTAPAAAPLDQMPPTAGPVVLAPTVRVKFLRAHRAFGYAIGEEAEISREHFDQYSQDGPYFKQL